MNCFRHAKDGSLDLQYLRICAVYRLMSKGTIAKDQAVHLLEQRNVSKARQTVELWTFKQRTYDDLHNRPVGTLRHTGLC